MILLNGSLFIVVGSIFYSFIRMAIVIKRYRKRVQIQWGYETLLLLLSLYLCMVVSVTLFPFPIRYNSDIDFGFSSAYLPINFIPLKSIIHNISLVGTAYGGDSWFMIGLIVKNVGGDLLLLMPLGFLAPFLWVKLRKKKNIILLGLSISVLIETLQFWESKSGAIGRVTDVDDIIFNVIGVFIGYLFYGLTVNILEKYIKPLSSKENVKGV